MQLLEQTLIFFFDHKELLTTLLVSLIAILKLTSWGRAQSAALDAVIGIVERVGDKKVNTDIATQEAQLKGNKPLELRFQAWHRAILYASDPAYLDAVLDEERGWRELSIPPISQLVFRHRLLADFSIEPFQFVAQARRRKNAPAEEAP